MLVALLPLPEGPLAPLPVPGEPAAAAEAKPGFCSKWRLRWLTSLAHRGFSGGICSFSTKKCTVSATHSLKPFLKDSASCGHCQLLPDLLFGSSADIADSGPPVSVWPEKKRKFVKWENLFTAHDDLTEKRLASMCMPLGTLKKSDKCEMTESTNYTLQFDRKMSQMTDFLRFKKVTYCCVHFCFRCCCFYSNP